MGDKFAAGAGAFVVYHPVDGIQRDRLLLHPRGGTRAVLGRGGTGNTPNLLPLTGIDGAEYGALAFVVGRWQAAAMKGPARSRFSSVTIAESAR